MLGRTDSRPRTLLAPRGPPRLRGGLRGAPGLLAAGPPRLARGAGPRPGRGADRDRRDPRHDLRPQRDGHPGDDDPPRPAGGLSGVARRRDARGAGTQRAEIAATLAGILGLAATPPPSSARAARLRQGLRRPRPRPHDRPVERRSAPRSTAAPSPQVRLEPEAVRVYPLEGGAPKTTIAAHLLGFANREGDGQYGVEGRWQDALAGAPRVVARRARRVGTAEPGTSRRRWRRAAPASTSR